MAPARRQGGPPPGRPCTQKATPSGRGERPILMRKDLISEASRRLHRRRGRVLIAASVAVLILGSALSMEIALSWRRDPRDAAAQRVPAGGQLPGSHVRPTVATQLHAPPGTRR